jgi:hypothetical protein
MQPEHLSVAAAAAHSGLSRAHVYRLVKARALGSTVRDGKTLVERRSLESFMEGRAAPRANGRRARGRQAPAGRGDEAEAPPPAAHEAGEGGAAVPPAPEPDPIAALRAENDSLRRRAAQLERELAEARALLMDQMRRASEERGQFLRILDKALAS